MKKQPKSTEKTKQAFIDVFCELYTQKPIEKISVQEITNKAGYNRCTFYEHFNDIYSLLNHVKDDVWDFLRQKAHEVHDVVQNVISLYKEKGTYLNALLGDYGNNHFAEKLKTEFPLEVQELALPDDNQFSPYLIEFHRATVLSLFRLWHSRQEDLSLDELVNLILRLYQGGLQQVNA